jgi:hypothetical protein
MSNNFNTVSATLHICIEQSYDLLLEQSTATGNINRIQVSARKQVSVTTSRVYTEEKGFIPPLLE